MQTVLVFLSCACFVVLALPQKEEDSTYTTKWDGIDLDQILVSDRLLKNYHNCLMDRGSCTPDVSELKRNLPDALKTDCSKCSAKQKEGSDKVIRFLIKNKADAWKELQAKYDPEGTYIAKNPQLMMMAMDQK